MSWVLDIAQRLGILGAPFFTQPCLICAVFYNVYQGALKLPLQGTSSIVLSQRQKMEKKERHNRAHVLVVPLPIQGHINPMLQFSMRLAFKGLTVTVLSATTEYSIQAQSSAVKIACISKRIDEGIDKHNLDTYFKHVTAVLSQGIPEIITKQNSSGFPFKCLVYDSAIPWALDIAKQHGLAGASFFTQSCAVGAIYCHVLQGLVTLPIQGPNVSMPGLPPLEIQDIPSFTHNPEAYPSILDLVLKQFFNLSEVDWILFNTIEILEDEKRPNY
ncbi:hypothetical protein RJ641_004528 [Dillenia turbinata]|uniref:Glycosyltransferase N-terminal domain-containing protein n=1 Tax=Dillenia turbinata TaxID=194707 RepID=A0AAN8Z8B5_9MAGN